MKRQTYVTVMTLLGLVCDLQLTVALPVDSTTQARPSLPLNFVSVRTSDYTTRRYSPELSGDSDDVTDWSYDEDIQGTAGPRGWRSLYPTCGSRLQSPIDIHHTGSNVRFRSIPPLNVTSTGNGGVSKFTIKNSGVTVSMKPTGSNMKVQGAGMTGRFIVSNLHFHWARTDNEGSEHKINGRAYPMELHVVSFNDKYRSKEEAAEEDDGLLVVAVLFETAAKAEHAGFQSLVEKLQKIKNPGSSIDGVDINVSQLLPNGNVPLFKYRGSTTSPPCTGNIRWLVYSLPQSISTSQMAKFRQLTLGNKVHPRGGNMRPVQPLGTRRIYSSNPQLS